MPKWIIYEYLHPQHGNLMTPWVKGLQPRERAKLDQKMDALYDHGTSLIPGMLTPTGTPSILKLRVRGQVQLRPMLCEGPGDMCFTFLMGAKEVQDDYEPKGAPATAALYRSDLFAHQERREINERINR